MKHLSLLFLLMAGSMLAQTTIPGRVIDRETRRPLPYAKISFSEDDFILTNIDGSFSIKLEENKAEIGVSYIGYRSLSTIITPSTQYLQIGLTPKFENLETVNINAQGNTAEKIIKQAIQNKYKNDPEKAIQGFSYTSYSKFLIDNEDSKFQFSTDSTSASMEIIIEDGRAYLSEKISTHYFNQKQGSKELVNALKTAGFKKPVYKVLAMEVNPFSLYKQKYQLYKTDYAGPLSNSALKNYEFKILDTTKGAHPAYVIYFKPKREQVVAGLEGILYLNTKTFAIQKAKAQLLGAMKLEVEHEYEYIAEKNIWFPVRQVTTLKPGAGGKEISVFGGTISVGTVQRKNNLIDRLFAKSILPRNLYLSSETRNFNIILNSNSRIINPSAEIEVEKNALHRTPEFWNENRKINFTAKDEATQTKVAKLIKEGDVEKKLSIKNAISGGYYPVGIWDVDLSKLFKYNHYEGIRLGFGGKTSNKISEKFNLNGYTTYGLKDEVVKYGFGTQIYLNKRNSTHLNLNFRRDIHEIASFKYLKGGNTFSILEPRFVNINNFYNYKDYQIALETKINTNVNAEFNLKRQEIWQITKYAFLHNNEIFTEYDLNLASISLLWQPFSRYLTTPDGVVSLEKKFPQLTAQIDQSIHGLGGDFSFTRLGLKLEHEIKRLDKSRTEFILEGNYAFGDIPLTHAFHALPNNRNKSEIFKRFSVAGRNSFETMYFNEFYSDRQAMFHVRHQLRPFRISKSIQPELVLISRHAIGDFKERDKHLNIEFGTLEHGYSEAGVELNKIIAGLGLSSAYRYGAYHLEGFKNNFSFKFTFLLQL